MAEDNCRDGEGTFSTRDGLAFYERRWAPAGEAVASIVLVHGYGEHCSRYESFSRVLNAAGFVVHTYDQRGFGHSPGRRAYIRCFDTLLDDLDDYLAFVRPRLAGRPWFMMSHSMGGLVMSLYAETRLAGGGTDGPRGLVFSSPFLGFSDEVPKILQALAPVVGTLLPWLPVGDVDSKYLAHDPAAVEAADNDPLSYHGKVKAGTGAQFSKAIKRARAGFGSITLPLFVFHGTDDRLAPFEGGRLLFEQCGSKDKTFKPFAGGYHELWNDYEKDAVASGVVEWIRAHL